MNKLALIIRREFLAKVRNKTFIIMTFLSPLLIIGFTALIVFLGKMNNDKAKVVAYLDESQLFTLQDFEPSDEISFLDFSRFTLDEAKVEAKKSQVYGLLYIPKRDSLSQIAQDFQFFSNDSPNISIVKNIEIRVENRLRIIRLNEMGITPEQIEQSKFEVDSKLSNFTGEVRSKFVNEMKAAVGSIAGYFIMLFILIYGTMVMRSVIEEKTSRIVEVIISSVKPFQLMMGKVLGTALAGVLQFLIWVVVISGILFFLATFFEVDLVASQTKMTAEQMATITESSNKMQLVLTEFLSLPLGSILLLYLFYFLGGFLLYSAMYAAIGAAVDNETDTQQFMMPVVMPLVLGIYVGFATVLSDPHGPVSVAFSHIPFTSPIVMLMRIPFGVPWWEIAISMSILILSFIFMIWFASKIYRIGILMYGKKPTYKDLYKWLKY
ncbi:MAG: ABC transporter permease [Flavobacteriaceae bacterium]|jgi:ABC-2 type transport system permease protein|nr:ABC transporter permease [Flavobacteriaceae bacterium]